MFSLVILAYFMKKKTFIFYEIKIIERLIIFVHYKESFLLLFYYFHVRLY